MQNTLVLLSFFFGFCCTAQQTYKLSQESTLYIHGTSTAHDWTVTTQKMQGSLQLHTDAIKEIEFEVLVADIQSERGAAMDKKMHAALKKEAHPKVRFLCKELKDSDSILIGTLHIAGVEKEVELTINTISSNRIITIKGDKELVLQDFDIKPPSAMFGQIVVGDTIRVQFDLMFIGN